MSPYRPEWRYYQDGRDLTVATGVSDIKRKARNKATRGEVPTTWPGTEEGSTHLHPTQLFEMAGLVRELRDVKSLEKAERKRLQIEHASESSIRAKQLKIADKICNVRDIALNPPADWPIQASSRVSGFPPAY